MRPATYIPLVLLALLPFLGMRQERAASSPEAAKPEPTAARLREKGWWPTKGDAARKDYAGTEACVECHRQKVLEQRETPMAHAASSASETELLRTRPKIEQAEPPFQTEIVREGKGSSYTVARGGEAIRGQLLWSMGQGTMGQTFILESGGALFESQLSYFTSIAALDLTPGHTLAGPKDLQGAFGVQQSEEIAQKCFACHTTVSSVRRQFDPAHATPGVTCEACHGPGARHVKAKRDGLPDSGQTAMFDPSSLDPVELVDYCGACHRASLDVASEKNLLPIDIRFQPYRLSKSRCWSQPDPRVTCVACHDPHQPLVKDVSSYDAKCLACHAPSQSASSRSAAPDKMQPACKVSASRCVSCHMPQYKVPQMHGSFTDHDIRIVRPEDPYPL